MVFILRKSFRRNRRNTGMRGFKSNFVISLVCYDQISRHVMHLVRSMYGMDPRSLLVLRMGVSVLILIDCWNRVGPFNGFLELEAFYGNNGLWPREYAMKYLSSRAFVLHYGVDTLDGYKFLFGMEAAAACFLFIGKGTRFATFVCWLLCTGSTRRNPSIYHSGDSLLRTVLMFMLFLPDSPCSVDTESLSFRNIRSLFTEKQTPRCSVATVAITANLGIVYMFSVFNKSYTSYVVNADVVKMILQFEHYTSWHALAGYMLMYAPDVCLKFLSRAVFFTEMIAGAVLIAPVLYSEKMRTYSVAILTAVQLGFFSHLYLGTFPWVMIVVHIACLPTYGWECLEKCIDINPPTTPPVYKRGGRTGVLSEITAAILFILILSSNVNTIRPHGHDTFVTSSYANQIIPTSTVMSQVEQMLGSRQTWNMFPFVTTEQFQGGKHIVVGFLENSTKINLHTLQPWSVDMVYRADPQYVMPNFRWRAYWRWLFDYNDPEQLQYAGRFQCHKYNTLGFRVEDYSGKLQSVVIYKLTYLVERFQSMPEGAPTIHHPHIEKTINVTCA